MDERGDVKINRERGSETEKATKGRRDGGQRAGGACVWGVLVWMLIRRKRRHEAETNAAERYCRGRCIEYVPGGDKKPKQAADGPKEEISLSAEAYQ